MNKISFSRISLTLVVAMVMLAGLWGWSVTSVGAADGDIVISEVMFNSYCSSTDGAAVTCAGTPSDIETQYEWVEIHNKGTAPVDIQNWQICDGAGCDIITTSTTAIQPGEYWLIGNFAEGLTAEMLNSLYGAYDPIHTILLGASSSANPIGSDGLGNFADVLSITNGAQAVDCVSWDSTAGTTCSGLTYVSGGDGQDTALSAEFNGQAIANIQGTWYYQTKVGNGFASPYASNTSTGGTTAVAVSSLKTGTHAGNVAFFAMATVAAGLVVLRKRR